MDSDDKTHNDEDTSPNNEDMLDDESLDEMVEELGETEDKQSESEEPEEDQDEVSDSESSLDKDDDNEVTEERRPEDIASEENAPADALTRTPEDIEQEAAENETKEKPTEESKAGPKKPSVVKEFFRKVNIYVLIFVLLLVVAGSVTVVFYLNSTKTPVEPGIANQDLTEEELKQLANTDAAIGNQTQTLTIRGSAVIDGQTLMRSNLNVAGNLQTSGAIQSPDLTVAGSSNLGTAQINSLQVAGDTVLQGDLSVRNLSVAGSSTFSGNMTASQITVTNLVMSGNALLEIPNHIRFSGPTPGRTILSGALGSGGSASINGSDTAGTVNINTGNNTATGCLVRINFHQAFTREPHVTITPVGASAAQFQYYVERNQNNFSICAANPAPANRAFSFDYFITN